jgi:hypothetical protein
VVARSAPRSPTAQAAAAHRIVVERHEVAGAVSGKSGGFLVLDWC